MLKLVQILVLVFFLGLAWSAAHASAMESYRYEETIGDVAKEFQWCLDKSEPMRLLYQCADETDITRIDASFATVQWEMEKKSDGTSLHARRLPDAIIIQGRWKGQQINKKLPIDDAPWYQATSCSFRPFVLSSRKEIRFWTVRYDTLKAHKIRAVKKRRQVLHLNGAEEDAVEVELRLSGMLALFWKCSYWFRRSDGVFLRFEGPSGPPGAPDMVVEYRGPAAPCPSRPSQRTNTRSSKRADESKSLVGPKIPLPNA
jgi:hypothetical protein